MNTAAIARNLERWRRAVATHDVENPTHESYGIGLSRFDLDRLELEDGEELWAGIRAEVDGGPSAMFRVLCNGEHDECDLRIKEAREVEQAREKEFAEV